MQIKSLFIVIVITIIIIIIKTLSLVIITIIITELTEKSSFLPEIPRIIYMISTH